jgi:hypothetical protein
LWLCKIEKGNFGNKLELALWHSVNKNLPWLLGMKLKFWSKQAGNSPRNFPNLRLLPNSGKFSRLAPNSGKS